MSLCLPRAMMINGHMHFFFFLPSCGLNSIYYTGFFLSQDFKILLNNAQTPVQHMDISINTMRLTKLTGSRVRGYGI